MGTSQAQLGSYEKSKKIFFKAGVDRRCHLEQHVSLL